MALTMVRPWWDASGTYHLRQRTPADLVKRLRGQRITRPVGDACLSSVKIGPIVQTSLRTKEAAVARKRHTAAHAGLTAYWDAQRKGPSKLSKKEIVALAGLAYHAFADTLENNPGEPVIWRNSGLRDADCAAQHMAWATAIATNRCGSSVTGHVKSFRRSH